MLGDEGCFFKKSIWKVQIGVNDTAAQMNSGSPCLEKRLNCYSAQLPGPPTTVAPWGKGHSLSWK